VSCPIGPSLIAFLYITSQSLLQQKSKRISESQAFILHSSTQKQLCNFVLFLFSQNQLFGWLGFALLHSFFFVLWAELIWLFKVFLQMSKALSLYMSLLYGAAKNPDPSNLNTA
jgi:hypothetical protein